MSLYNDASLVMIPSAYKDGKLYSIKPTDGSGDFTFSRGSNLAATRVNEQGLIEKGRSNQILQSNTFSTTWSNTRSTETGGQAGYDGSSDAWLLESTTTAQSARVYQSITKSYVHTMSVYAKAGTSDWVALLTDGNQQAYFDLANGVVGSTSGVDVIDSNIEAVGATGWYRCSATFNGNDTFSIFIANGDNNLITNSGDNIYIQDAQVEQGLVATDYIETTTTTAQAGILEDMPRLDYSGGASCPSLLLEPQRTNLVTQSEYFSAWTPSALTITDNDAVSPEGISNAAKLTLPSGSATKRIALGSMPNSAVARSYSFFVKSNDITAVQLVHSGDIQGYARFDISNGVIGSMGSKTTSSIENYGDGWYRCIANFDSTNIFGSTIYLYINDDASGGYGGSTAAQGDLFVYGAQYEEGSYPTSYIPCYGAATTRSKDSCSKTGISSLIGQEQGTIFVEATNFFASGLRTIATLWTSSSAFYQVYINASNQVRVDISGSFIFLGGSIAANTNYKIAFAYKSGEYALYINGTQIATSTNTTIPSSLTDYYLGNLLGGEQSGEFAQTALFKTRLTNGELAALTTL